MSRAAIIGGGVVGGGWAARFLLNGWDVAVYDPDPEAERKIGEILQNARRSLPALYDRALPAEGRLSFCHQIDQVVAGADWIQESVSERLELKHAVYTEIAAFTEGACIGSSTSGFKPSELAACGVPVVVTHPFNPVYLLPLVEISGDTALCRKAAEIITGLGMFPLVLQQEIDAFIGNRFQEAIWREALWMLKDGVATTEEIDNAIRMSIGLRWAQMGLFETYRIAGGEAGMAHFFQQFGPSLGWPWSRLTDVPDLDDALIALISHQSDEQSGALSIRELERLRDDNLVGILRSLRHKGSGAGQVLLDHEACLPAGEMIDGLPVTSRQAVPVTWTDYNGHMNEAAYLELGTRATDGLMRLVGADADYIASGKSFFTVDTRIRYLDEVHRGAVLTITTQVIAAAGKKMHLFHRVLKAGGSLAATIETLLLHTDLDTRRSCPPEPTVAKALKELADMHAGRPAEGCGSAVGQRG